MSKNNLSHVLSEFDKRYKYCFEELEKHYQECFTSDIKSDKWHKKYWLTKADSIDKIVKELQNCAIDARCIVEIYKKE